MARREPTTRDTQQRILDAALDVFTRRGYRDASIDDVAAQAGVTKGAVYYYWASKDDLATDLQSRLWDDLAIRALQALDPEADTVETLTAGFRAFMHALQETPNARFFLRETWAGVSAPRTSREQEALGLVRALIENGIERGELRDLDAESLAVVVFGAFVEATFQILETERVEPMAEVVYHMIRSLAPGGASEPEIHLGTDVTGDVTTAKGP